MVVLTVDDYDEIVTVSTDGIVMRCGVKDIRTIGRNTQGVKVMSPSPGALVSAVAKAVADSKEERITGDPASDLDIPEDDIGENGSEDLEPGGEEE